MRIGIGSDHRGIALKQAIVTLLKGKGHEIQDVGAYNSESVDYPDYALPVAQGVSSGKYEYGILICSTGIGMCIAANKVDKVRAALCRTAKDAARSRQHNDANVVCLSAEDTSLEINLEIVTIFLSTPFDGGRHQRRIDKISTIESG